MPALHFSSVHFGHSVLSDSGTPWTTARQASLSITNTRSLLKLMSIESVMPSNHLILCRLFLLPPSIFPSIRVFSNESVLQHSAFFMVQLSHLYVTAGKTMALTIGTFIGKVMPLLFNMVFRFVMAFLPRSKHL